MRAELRALVPRVLVLLALALPALAQAPSPERVVVGSKNFPESRLLGEVLALLLEEHAGLEVEHRSGLGGTLVCFTALETGEIDLYPEYTGTGWAVILKETGRSTDPLRTWSEVERLTRERTDARWLAPFGFENTYAIAMDEERAAELGIATLSDLAREGGALRAGLSLEFLEREDGWPGLAAAYGLELAEVRGMEHGLAYGAVASGEIDLLDAYSTDGRLAGAGLRLLEDDRRFFPPYHAAPLVRARVLEEHPALRPLLERLAWRLDEARMTALNHAVEVEGRAFRDVARELLEEEGLVGASDAAEAAPRGAEGLGAFLLGRRAETLRLVLEHLHLTLLSVLLASLLAIPLGIAITRRRLAERLSLGAAGVVQTIPSLALLAFFIAVPGLGLSTGSAVLALTLYAVLPILRSTFTGLTEVDPDLVDAATGMGLTPRQVLLRVQLPLAVRSIMGGVRTATVITIGFATLAAFIGAGGLGEPILTGLYLDDTRLVLAGALPAALLALGADLVLGRLERALTPRGVRER
jgi:osmoprotectant transport system permease protein